MKITLFVSSLILISGVLYLSGLYESISDSTSNSAADILPPGNIQLTKNITNDRTYVFTHKNKPGAVKVDTLDQGDEVKNTFVWDVVDADEPIIHPNGVHAVPIKTDPKALTEFHSGQNVELPIPQANAVYFGTIDKEKIELDGRVVSWSGPLNDGVDGTAFGIARGQRMTLIYVTSMSGDYEININNKTGEGEVIDSREYDKLKKGTDVVEMEESDAINPPNGVEAVVVPSTVILPSE